VNFKGYEGAFRIGDSSLVAHFAEGEFVDVSGVSR
jgi:large subunit ribosomal protein L3